MDITWYNRTSRSKMATTTDVNKERTTKERFDYAVSVIRSLPKDGPFQPSNMMKLKFYGLYKQVTQGTNTTPKPGFWDPTSRAKWEAWNLCRDMCSEEAMQLYVKELGQIVETMPQTKEVEEFLKMIGPLYEIVEEEKEEEDDDNNKGQDKGEEDSEEKLPNGTLERTDNDQEEEEEEKVTSGNSDRTDNDQEEEKEEENVTSGNSDSDDELEFQDSYDNLPEGQRTPVTSPQPTRTHKPTPYAHGSPVDPALHDESSTPSLGNISQFTLDITTPSSFSSPSVTNPSSHPPLQMTPLRTASSAESMGGTTTQHSSTSQPTAPLLSSQSRREVRFSNTVTSISPEASRGGRGGGGGGTRQDQQVSLLRVTEMISQLQQNLQVVIQQFNSIVQILNQYHHQQQQSVEVDDVARRRRRSRSRLLGMFYKVLPLVSTIVTTYLYCGTVLHFWLVLPKRADSSSMELEMPC